MGTDDTEEIINNFEMGHVQNFEDYKFINELFESLKEVEKQYQELVE